MTVTTVVKGTNSDLIEHIWPLWFGPDDLVLDMTYGRGNWWKNVEPHLLTRFRGNFTRLPERHYNHYHVVVYDPPYVSVGGRDTHGEAGREMSDRYGMDLTGRSPASNRVIIAQGFIEGYKALLHKGLLMAKSADYISSGHFQSGHRDILDLGKLFDMELVDEFVHWSGTGPQPTGRRQVHAHHSHSYLTILRKRRK